MWLKVLLDRDIFFTNYFNFISYNYEKLLYQLSNHIKNLYIEVYIILSI
jgi:hypothetical protein